VILKDVNFIQQSTLIPEELELEVAHIPSILTPVVYSHFLRFLCHYHLNNVNQCYSALADLQLTISEDYFILDNVDRSNSYNCLGVAYVLIGNHEMAERSFLQAIELDTTYNCASQRLYVIHRTSTVSDPTV
jgi:lipoprotein NlpI